MHPVTSNTAPERDRWDLVIEPHGHVLDLKLRELWQYRDLIALFVRRDFVAQYKQTILGPAWHLIQPLLTTITFTIIFGKIAKIPTDGVPPFLFFMAGTVLWTYFSGVLTGTSGTFTSNAGIFGKVYFPRLAVPVAGLLSKLIAFGIQFLFFLCFLAFFMWRGADVAPNAWALLTPLLLLMMAALGLGLGVIVSSLTTRYRDLTVVVGFGVQLLMYATPVIYPLSVLPEPYRTWMLLNPMAPIMEIFRHAYLGAGDVSVGLLLYAAALIGLILVVGILLFNRVERTFMDTV
ncbi:ABC transporter permease [Thiocapsa roseopersicina]|uniref:Transport permease protein n=1 Tax=Thiocapsa roseopersicina TaxID=1058 RepID=A0A1H2QA28_THIRO|nr:ABC transporter permease [Thiocapsa roseopersicina]SDW04011.1 lipopolysaccharide transport system permease protein [Thiocapsa roseopersicina]